MDFAPEPSEVWCSYFESLGTNKSWTCSGEDQGPREPVLGLVLGKPVVRLTRENRIRVCGAWKLGAGCGADLGAGLGAECGGFEIMVRDVVLTWVWGVGVECERG